MSALQTLPFISQQSNFGPVAHVLFFCLGTGVPRHSAGTYVLRSTRRNSMDRIAKPKPHTLKLILVFNEKVVLLACSVLRQIIAGV